MANPQLISGARGIIGRVDLSTGEISPLAFATDITVNIRQGVRQTYVVGRMNPGAIDSLTYDVDVSVGRVVPVNAADANANAEGEVESREETATAIGLGFEPLITAFTSAEDLSIALQDKVTGQFISSVRNCRFAGRTIGTNANDIAQERMNFIGIYDSGVDGENAASFLGYQGE